MGLGLVRVGLRVRVRVRVRFGVRLRARVMARERIGSLAVERSIGGGALCGGRVEVKLGLLGRDERLAAVVHQVGHHELVDRRVEQQHLEVIVRVVVVSLVDMVKSAVSLVSLVQQQHHDGLLLPTSYFLLFTSYLLLTTAYSPRGP